MWLEELDLDPSVPWLQMGTRSLGDRPWLVSDERRDGELWLRRDLLQNQADEVLVEPDDAGDAAAELEDLVRSNGVRIADGPTPLRRLGVSIQEDLCLLQRDGDQWVLRSGVLCFPSRWRLGAKIDKPLIGVHAPVEGYEDTLGSRVDRLISGLGDRTVLRRNWFIHPDAALFQPDRPATDPVVAAEHCLDALFVRSERQTLRLLPTSGWCVFTIRIQHCRLGELVAARGAEFGAWLAHADQATRGHRGLSSEQVVQLEMALTV